MDKLNSSLFDISHPTPAPKKGDLLVAEPFLREAFFNHAVILLTEYAPGAKAMGLVLNTPTPFTLSKVLDCFDNEVNEPVYIGGPMSTDRLFFLHALPEMIPGGLEVARGVYIGGDFGKLTSYINMGLPLEGKVRFFCGYSGWDAGQLEEETAAHTWAVTAPDCAEDILTPKGSAMWYETVRRMGPGYRNWLYHPAHPELN